MAWGKGVYTALREAMAASNSLGRTTGQTGSHSPQRVHSLVTKPACCWMAIRKAPALPSTFTTSALFSTSMLGCSPTSESFGASMQTEQSSVGKFLSRAAILPPMDGPFSTRITLAPASARSSAAWTPAMPPPMMSTESLMPWLLSTHARSRARTPAGSAPPGPGGRWCGSTPPALCG